MQIKRFFKWLSVIVIYPFTLYIILITQTEYNPALLLAIFILLITILIIMILFKLYKTKENETQTIDRKDLTGKSAGMTVELCIVGKNENRDIIKTLEHYLSFPDSFKITVYDDQSDDGSYENMITLAEKHRGRLTIKRLVRSEKTLHPKGMGVESFIDETEADLLLINDADTIITLNDFEKALNFLIEKKYDVVHLSRRNDLSNAQSNRVSDTEEIANTALKLFGINEWCFPGSGILMMKEAAQVINYRDFVPGDDLEMGRQLKATGKEIYHFQTLFAHERAPENFRNFYNQRAKWCRNIAYHLLENEGSGSHIQATGSSFALFFLFGLSSPLSLIIIFIGIAYTLLSIFSSMILASRDFSKSFIPAIMNTLQLWVQAAVFTPYYLIIYPFKRNQMTYSKSRI